MKENKKMSHSTKLEVNDLKPKKNDKQPFKWNSLMKEGNKLWWRLNIQSRYNKKINET